MTREELMQVFKLSHEELDGLLLLAKKMQPGAHGKLELAVEEKRRVVAFLEQSIGNMELNKKLLELGKLDQEDTGISYSVLNTLRNITFKSRHWQDVHFDALNKNSLPDLASLSRDLAVLERSGFIKDSSSLSSLFRDTQKAQEIVNTLDKRSAKEEQASFNELFFEIKPTKGTHMFPSEYRSDEFILTEFLYSEEYKIKLDKLIHDETKEFLKKHLGDDWLHQLETKFGVIQREIHDAQLIGPIYRGLIHPDVLDQKRFWSEDKSSVRLICSPSVGVCTLAVIKELNEQIIQELKNKGIKEIPSPLLQLPISDTLEVLSPSHFIDIMSKCEAVERLAGQATSSMRARLSEAKDKGEEEDHPSTHPK